MVKEDGSRSLERLVGWGHPELIQECYTGGLRVFVDGTFKSAPAPFVQLLTVMIHIERHDEYVPIFYVLMESKNYVAYYHALHHVIAATDFRLACSTATGDFEPGLIRAIKEQLLNYARTDIGI